MSTAGFLTGKVFLFGCCEPLRSFRYIDSLSHLHLEIITIYMSTSIFMYTCHMFAGSFQNQGSILNIYILHINLQCAYKKVALFVLGRFFPIHITDLSRVFPVRFLETNAMAGSPGPSQWQNGSMKPWHFACHFVASPRRSLPSKMAMKIDAEMGVS